MYQNFFKTLLDKAGALVLLFIFLPLFLLILLIQVFFSCKPFFLQRRAGKGGAPFTLIKFRTMKDLQDNSGRLLSDDLRLTTWGTFLRMTSLDEIPQLLNILRGEMSLVGPRPLPLHYTERYSKEQKKRLSVKPGLTGLVQIMGRNQLDWDERFKLDNKYIRDISFTYDLKILFLTGLRFLNLNKDKTYSEEFMGNEQYEQDLPLSS